MEPVLLTPRLKLTLITHAERGSEQLQWLHELRSNTQTTAWSIHPPSKTLDDTEKLAQAYLPHTTPPAPPAAANLPTRGELPKDKAYKIAYAVHELRPNTPPRFIGLLTLISLSDSSLPLPAHLVPPQSQQATTLVVELAYSFLPFSWGKGYATEALEVLLDACRSRASPGEEDFWAPWGEVWVRAIVNKRNGASLRVMRKLGGRGVGEMGVYEWKGERIFIGGEWMTEDDLYIFGGWLRE